MGSSSFSSLSTRDHINFSEIMYQSWADSGSDDRFHQPSRGAVNPLWDLLNMSSIQNFWVERAGLRATNRQLNVRIGPNADVSSSEPSKPLL